MDSISRLVKARAFSLSEIQQKKTPQELTFSEGFEKTATKNKILDHVDISSLKSIDMGERVPMQLENMTFKNASPEMIEKFSKTFATFELKPDLVMNAKKQDENFDPSQTPTYHQMAAQSYASHGHEELAQWHQEQYELKKDDPRYQNLPTVRERWVESLERFPQSVGAVSLSAHRMRKIAHHMELEGGSKQTIESLKKMASDMMGAINDFQKSKMNQE